MHLDRSGFEPRRQHGASEAVEEEAGQAEEEGDDFVLVCSRHVKDTWTVTFVEACLFVVLLKLNKSYVLQQLGP